MERRIQQELRRRVSGDETTAVGHLFVVPDETLPPASRASMIPDLPSRYIASSAEALSDRREGRCLLSYETAGGWVAVSKNVLTEVLGAGRDAKIALPPAAAGVLQLMCPDLIGRPEDVP